MSLITISESIGCGGKAIAALVAKELKLELYDDRRLEEEAIQLGVQPEALKDLDEKAPGLFSRMFSDKPQVYLDLLQGVVYEVAKRGQGIILGHGSQVLLRDFGCALHVRIYGSESSRIEYLMGFRVCFTCTHLRFRVLQDRVSDEGTRSEPRGDGEIDPQNRQ
jgi:hypothetical protein